MRILSVQNQQILIKTTMPGMSQALGTSFQLLEAWIEVLIVLDDICIWERTWNPQGSHSSHGMAARKKSINSTDTCQRFAPVALALDWPVNCMWHHLTIFESMSLSDGTLKPGFSGSWKYHTVSGSLEKENNIATRCYEYVKNVEAEVKFQKSHGKSFKRTYFKTAWRQLEDSLKTAWKQKSRAHSTQLWRTVRHLWVPGDWWRMEVFKAAYVEHM